MGNKMSKDNKLIRDVLMITKYTIETHSTVRDTAKKFELSKSTVHRYLTVKLEGINKKMYKEVRKILDENNKNKHVEGGNSTKIKFMNIKKGWLK